MYNTHKDMILLRENALNIWTGRKTRVHQAAGKTPAIFVIRRIKCNLMCGDVDINEKEIIHFS